MGGTPRKHQMPTNERKFATANPIVQRMIGDFFEVLRDTIAPLQPQSTLDAGCGEGETIERLGALLGKRIAAIDVEPYCVARTGERHPAVQVIEGSITDLPFSDSDFDLVLCLEVLEHLENPAAAVRELARAGSRDVVVSVPAEPWFRLGSLARGKYVRTFGNHPEHINHFNRRSLASLLSGELEDVEIKWAFPWLIAHGRTGRA